MLIIEIRDNTIRLIQAGNKVKTFTVKNAKTFDFEEGWKTFISNPDNASALTEAIKTYSKESKALLCLNTSSVIYREMVVPKASPRYLNTMIRHELNHALNLSNDYLMDYTIIGETIKNDTKMNKILVTAVLAQTLNEIVDFFDKIKLQIIKIDVSLNSLQKYVEITKLVNKDTNTLFADIGSSSIRQYLFEKGKYSVYRTTKVAALAQSEEELSLETTTETIEKMVQFALSQGQNSGIEHIYLFGTYPHIEHLKLHISDTLGLDTQVLSRPKILIDSKHRQFAHDDVYALGSLFSQSFKRKKDINLLVAYNSFYSRSSSTLNLDALFNSLAFGLGYVALFALIFVTLQTNLVNSDIQKINNYLNQPSVIETLAKIASMKENIASLNEISAELTSIQTVLDSIPRFSDVKIKDLLTVMPSGLRLSALSFAENDVTLSITATNPSLIHHYVLRLSEVEAFSDVTYTTYQYETNSRLYTSEIHLTLKGETQ